MINVGMTIKYTDARVQPVTVRPVTQVAFERKFSRGFASCFGDVTELQLEWVYFLAWHAARTGLEFDEWLDTVAEIDMGEEPTEVVPFDPATSAG